MRARLRVERCGADDVPELQAFVGTHWPQADHVLARDAELLRWQYRALDADGETSVLLARDGDGIAGFLGVIETGFGVRGRRVRGGWLAMWVVAPDARETGAGLRLLRAALDRYDVVGCVGFNDTAERIFAASGFSILPALPRWTLVLDAGAVERLVAAEAARYADDVRERWLAQSAAAARADGELEPWRAEHWDETWSRLARGLIGTWRDADYLRWRYADHPRFRYELRAAESGEGLVVWRVEGVRDRSERVLRVVELVGDPGALPQLVSGAVAAGLEAGAAFVDASLTLEEPAAALERAGFARDTADAQPLPSLFQPLDFGRTRVRLALRAAAGDELGDGRLAERPDLYVTRADGDQDRPN